MRFSEKYGLKPMKTAIQKDSMDQDLRNSLWNSLQISYWDNLQADYHGRHYLSGLGNESFNLLCRRLWHNYFKQPLDTLPNNWIDVYQRLREYFFKCSWHEAYDFIQFVAQNYPDDQRKTNENFMDFCNRVLERELPAYRFIDGELAPIIDKEEIGAIEDALKVKISPVRAHLESSLQKLSDRKNPDYRNSIKESISAVEALVTKVTGSDKGTLGQLLKLLDDKTGLHPALKAAFDKLYGYTSDADGIRHALLDEDKSTFEEAKFMLVACSAFTNYVTGTLKK